MCWSVLGCKLFFFTFVWTVNLTLSLSQSASGMSMSREASLFRSTDTERIYGERIQKNTPKM